MTTVTTQAKTGGGLSEKDVWGDEAASALDAQIASMDVQQLNSRTRMLENNIKIMRSELNRCGRGPEIDFPFIPGLRVCRLTHESKTLEAKIKENAEKIKMNKQLPYLVSNVIEVPQPPRRFSLTVLRPDSGPEGRGRRG